MRIWKYTIEIVDLQFIEMPIGAKILTAQMQNGDLQIWAIVDELKEKESRAIVIYGTGNPIPDSSITRQPIKYISTVQLDFELVFHIFERE